MLSVLVVLSAGCQVVDRFTNPEDPCVSDTYVFSDDFEDAALCGWAQYDSAGTTARIEDGVMRVSVGNNGQMAWSNPGGEFTDTIIQVDATPVSGPENNAYGLICRYVDAENFYVFVVSSDGYYAIGKYVDGIPQIQYLTGEAPYYYEASDAIRTGTASNRIEARCIGDQLTLFANNQLLTSVQDGSLTAGDIGVTAGSFELGTVEVEFDNLIVEAP